MRRSYTTLLTAVAILIGGSFLAAFEPPQRHSFKVTIEGDILVSGDGVKEKIDADTVLRYTWTSEGNHRSLALDSLKVKATGNGRTMIDSFMSREKFVISTDGATDEIMAESAPAELKEMLLDSFGETVCKLEVDSDLKEIKREITAKAGAKTLVDQGMISNGVLFHPPHYSNKNEWSSPTEVSMGNGGYVTGDLTYEKMEETDGVKRYSVTGTLKNAGFKLPGQPIEIKNATYVVKGEQSFDLGKKEWQKGRWVIDVSYDMNSGGKVVATTSGEMIIGFEVVPKE